MAESSIIYAGEDTAADGSPILEVFRRPAIKALSYDEVLSWGVTATGSRPDFIWFRGDLYLVGGYSRPLVRHRAEARWRPAGIRPPDDTITVVEGTDSGGSPGQAVCYATFVHKQGDLLLAESAPSNITKLFDQTGKGYVWTLQTAGAEKRVTHVRGYRSMNGGAYRLAFEVPYGTSAYTENVRTNQLLQNGPEGHNLPPFGVKFAAKAFGRMWYARTNEYPHRLWGSQPGNPQYVPLTNYRDTDDREAITGLAKSRDVLLVFCLNSIYILRKHGGAGFDFTLQKIDSAVGCTSHWAIREIHNKLYFPSPDGVWLYDGGLRYAMADLRDFYRKDYKANPAEFSRAFAVDDRTGKNYILYVPRPSKGSFEGESSVGTVAYVGNYLNFEPSIGGQNEAPDWSIDLFGREMTSAFYTERGEALVSDDAGTVRIYDDDDEDDDGDSLQKHVVIETGHQLFMDPGDDIEGGKLFKPLYFHMESEFNPWKLSLFGGDESAAKGLTRDNVSAWWKKDVPESLLLGPQGSDVAKYVSKSVHFTVPEGVGGRGLTVLLEAFRNKGMSFRGWGGWYAPGSTQRGSELVGTPQTANYFVAFEYEDPLNPGTWIAISFGSGADLDDADNPHNLRFRIVGTPVAPAFARMVIEDSSNNEVAVAAHAALEETTNWTSPGDEVTLPLGTNTWRIFIMDSDGECIDREEELRVT